MYYIIFQDFLVAIESIWYFLHEWICQSSILIHNIHVLHFVIIGCTWRMFLLHFDSPL
jgi:hypothetical protein